MRHHSAALSAALPGWLDEVRPSVIYLEAAPELQPWFTWLGHPDLIAPVVLAAARPGRLGFYPFADFSPELAAVRWAVANDVQVVAIDAPVRAVLPSESGERDARFRAVLERAGARDLADFWDQEIEARAHASSAEELRRASLAVGLALRQAGPSASDNVREQYMRQALAEAPDGSVAIVGSFHAQGLLDGPTVPVELSEDEAVTSLVPYTWDLFDLRSGYPAGVRDPGLQQAFLEAFQRQQPPRDVVADALVRVVRELRRQGHTGGVPDSTEGLRMAVDLARLRGRKEPGRRELMEAIEATMGQGQRRGRGAALARAMATCLIGDRRGRLAKQTPKSGLRVALQELVAELNLPGPGAPEKSIRLDPLRSELDRRRQVTLLQVHACGIDYASEVPSNQDLLGATWTLRWTPATAATASLAGVHGVTLPMAAGGMIAQRWRQAERSDELTPLTQVQLLALAAEAGVLGEASLSLSSLGEAAFVRDAGLVELVAGLNLLARVEAGHCLGTAPDRADDVERARLHRAGVRQIQALDGTTDPDEIRAMGELTVQLSQGPFRATVERAIEHLGREGGPTVQGAARMLAVGLGHSAAEVGTWLTSRVFAATNPDLRTALRESLSGALLLGADVLEAEPSVLDPLLAWVEQAEPEAFFSRLPALRGGFHSLSPAARQRFLDGLKERYGAFDDELQTDPVRLARLAEADRLARAAVEALLGLPEVTPGEPGETRTSAVAPDRWRLILGRERQRLTGQARRVARSLDELYGRGDGEGSRGGTVSDDPITVREWSGELEELFGARVRDEVLAAAGEAGRGAAFGELSPEDVRPSIDLLRQLLSLAGSLGEGRLERVRRLVQHVTDDLVRELALRVRPAVSGAALPRPTSRRTATLDLPRTVRRNLAHIRNGPDGPMLIPERLIFKSGSQRSVDWQLFLVVDVSGSMEPSVLYAAMMASILSSVPWLGVQFYAFNTDVIDLSEHVDDPLALLLEVRVGGGTQIGTALKYTADQITVPSRAMVVVVSDFEEGGSPTMLLSQVRSMVQSGTKVLGVAALDDSGGARYHAGIAGQVVAAGAPVAAVSPLELARWVGEVVHA